MKVNEQIESNNARGTTRGKIAVIGMGYVGIPAAVLFAEAGYDVTGIQRRSERSGWKIDWLNEGRCPIGDREPELPDILHKVWVEKHFRATDDYSVVKDADYILIDVQTPTDENHVPRYESLKEVCARISGFLSPGQVVIIESTVAPGTTEYLVKPILEAGSKLPAKLPEGFGLCFSYERVMIGRLIHNIREYPKIVGGIDAQTTKITIDLYKSIVNAGVYGTDPMTAEVSKTVENAYRDVQIAFANEMAILCESLGTDVYQVREIVNGLPNDPSEPEANPVRNMHFPGAGVGGHCLPKDSWLLLHGFTTYAKSHNDYPVSLIKNARQINDWMPLHVTDLLQTAFSEAGLEMKGRTVAVLGYAFLANSDDARNTPTVALLQEMEKRGVSFKIHDPFIKHTEEGYNIEPDIVSAVKDCDALVIMTRHDEYKTLSPSELSRLMRGRIIVDGRNVFNPERFGTAGYIFKGIGKGKISGDGH